MLRAGSSSHFKHNFFNIEGNKPQSGLNCKVRSFHNSRYMWHDLGPKGGGGGGGFISVIL